MIIRVFVSCFQVFLSTKNSGKPTHINVLVLYTPLYPMVILYMYSINVPNILYSKWGGSINADTPVHHPF